MEFNCRLTCAMPDPIRPPPTTVTVLIAFLEVELEKFLVKPTNLIIFNLQMFTRFVAANEKRKLRVNTPGKLCGEFYRGIGQCTYTTLGLPAYESESHSTGVQSSQFVKLLSLLSRVYFVGSLIKTNDNTTIYLTFSCLPAA